MEFWLSIMDSWSASERSVRPECASMIIRRHQKLFDLKSTYICFIGSLTFLPDVTGQLHKDVLLPCTVTYKEQFDYSHTVIHWQRSENDDVVHSFYDGSSQFAYQADSYRGRTEMFYDLLPSGNLSLLLKNLLMSDAGSYACHSILKSSGFTMQYVILRVEERSDDQIEEYKFLSKARIAICLVSVAFIWGFGLLLFVKLRQTRNEKDEETMSLINNPSGYILQEYKKHLTSILRKDYSDQNRRLFVKIHSFLECSGTKNIYIGDKSEAINAEDLFTPGNRRVLSRRMVLVGDAGTGKSYFCKWLQNKWIQEHIKMYKCILRISCKKIKSNMSLKEICDKIYNGLSSILTMDGVLLIFDELDDLVHGNEDPSSNQEYDMNTPLNIYTLLEKIMTKQLVPNTDVLMVCRFDSLIDLQEKCNSEFILLDFTEEETKNIYDRNTTKDQKLGNKEERISRITYTPAFVVLMSYFKAESNLIINGDSSPYQLLTEIMLKWITNSIGKSREMKNMFISMANDSYENLIKGKPNHIKPWKKFLNLYNCQTQYKYQCNMLRDMLAAAHCVWETHRTGDLTECLDFWVFGNNTIPSTNALLQSIADEHNAKFYHFIRFFMRLLKYPNCDSLCDKTHTMNDKTQELLSDWLKKSFQNYKKPSEKLKIIHCIFELHDEKVTKEVMANMKKFELFNTPLNVKDIQALEYCFKGIALENLDLRLCALEDKDVRQLRSMIKKTKNVMLSSNHLTKETGKCLKEILQEPGCIIEKLWLGTNQLGAHGTQDLWRALEINKTLIGLYLYDNNVTDEGTHEMVEYLQKNTSLEELHLCGNTFGDEGLRNIQKLKHNKKELKVVLRIVENLELFQFVEEKIFELKWTRKNYHQEYLNSLLDAVLKDLEMKDCNKRPEITEKSINTLIQIIKEELKHERQEE
ncbi:uncharacterized protein LOC122927774 [Bufo gargarizans]|uniref:uncharacterized protein LOC122927774 n=1 Tax=Bufo gargarizans TaxID=30331 RepID=UPI001CF341CD|nr:uncharacterized protein LOC122927774 [Bufo gargarizans]